MTLPRLTPTQRGGLSMLATAGRNGARFRRAEAAKYLNRAEREQYQAGRIAFLGQLSTVGETGDRAATMKRRKLAFLAIAVAALLAGCGGGIGLEAMLADRNCEQAGYQLGTPQYAGCRMELTRRSAINNVAMF